MCALADPQPANHQEIELSAITDSPLETEREEDRRAQGMASRFTDARTQKNSQISNTVTFDTVNEHCAQPINSGLGDACKMEYITDKKLDKTLNPARFNRRKEHRAQPIMWDMEGARTQEYVPDSNTVKYDGQNIRGAQESTPEFEDMRTRNVSPGMTRAEIHAKDIDTQHDWHLQESDNSSDIGSLITQAPEPESIRATINALSSWVSSIQPRESWYLAGWIRDSPIEFLVDPGAVVSAISRQCYEELLETNAILTPMKAIHMELEAANKSDMSVHGTCNLDLSVHGLVINMDALVVDLNCNAILGMDVLGDASKLPFILDLVGGTLSGGGYETIQLHRFQAATECFAETTESVCIPPHSEVMLWAKLKTNNGRRGPTAGVVLALQSFVQEFGLLVGRSLVRADVDDWRVPILIYNSDPCTMQPADCLCNPIIVPAHTRIARVEEIQAIQHIGSRYIDTNTEQNTLPPHLIDVLDAATELTPIQRARAATLLAKHVKTFPAPGTPITGRTEAVMHDIDTGSTRPIRCNPRKLSPKKIKIQQELVDKMLEEGQIEHSVSAWSAPTVLVTKKDGTTRFCVDYRRLNNSTKKDAFPLPRIDDSLNSLSGQSWFSTLDLASGYWQVKLSEDAKPKTAFATHSGLFQFAVMPFGLCNAPATFERLMSQVMRGLHWKRCLVYIDDILVFGHDFESALESLELVLIRVAEYGLQLKSTKCNLFRSSVPFLGHIVGRAGLECDPSKVSAVANWIPPTTTKGVREFLGFTGYYRRFVPDYSTVAQPLVRLLGKDCKFHWTDACQVAFMALRALLIKAPVLAFPKEDLPYIVDTDASDYGIGGVLSQCIEGTEHVIAYYSKSLNPAQQKYCTTRRELLAVVATLDHFKGYVWGPKFLVRTDHAALVWLKNLKNIQGMLARWLAKLQQFHFDIIHRPGAQHGNADGLSRCPQCDRGTCAPIKISVTSDPEQPYASSCVGSSLDSELIPLESGETCMAAVMLTQSANSKLITEAQMTDIDITIVRSWFIARKFPARTQEFAPASHDLKSYWIGRKSLFLDDNNILWRNRSEKSLRAQLVVPRSLRDTVFNDSHHTTYGGHFGITHTHSKLQLHYFWPGMSDFVRDRISACHKCVARKSPVNRHHPMGHVPVSGKFERVAMDLLDVSVISAKGFKYILVVCDYFTKYTEAYPLKDKTARSVVDALMDVWLPRYGFPLFLHSDQGKEFDNVMIHQLSELLGTVKTKTTPYHPRSDGLVERFNRTLLAMLAMFVSQEHDNWDDLLPFMMLAYNTTVHTSTGYTPYRLVFGDECNLPGNLVHRELRADPPPGDPGTYASWVQQALYESYDEVRAQQQRATHRQKRNYDSKAVARAFPINCWTLRYYPPARKNKLCSPWIGPYKVVRAPMEWVVGIQLNADARIIYVHMDDLKRCAPPDPEPTWPDAARGTSVVVSTRAPSTLARSDVTRGQSALIDTSNIGGSAHHTESTNSGHTALRAPTLSVFTNGAHHMGSSLSDQIDVRAPEKDVKVKSDTVNNSMVNIYPAPTSTWDLQDENCLLSMKSPCSIDVQGYRFFTMERLFYALQLISLGDRKLIGQLAKYSRMDYVRKCVNTRFEMASSTLQNKWLDEQFHTWAQIISARVLSDSAFKNALLDSAGSPLFDPEEPVYATALTSARRLCVQGKTLRWPTWISIPTRVTRGRALI